MKQIAKVLGAVIDGCKTTRDLAEVTGLPMVTCSSCVHELVRNGTLRYVGKIRGVGRPLKIFRIAVQEAAE